MKRADFIELWCDTVRDGRRRNYPTIRASEEVFSGLDDMKVAAKWWRKHRAQWAAMTRDQVLEAITGNTAPACHPN